MKHKYVLAAFTVIIPLSTFGVAYAQNSGITIRNNNAIEASVQVQGNATSTRAKNEHASTTVVSTFVQSLLNVANREGGIGIQVREIAKTQNDSATTTASAMAKVEGRSFVKTLLLGSDYKNLKIIQNELATTTKNIIRLKSLINETVDDRDRVELNAQIQALENEQAEINAYVTDHEDAFSIFGWFMRLFS